jgi:hypothetical protein
MKTIFLKVNAQNGDVTDWADNAIATLGVVHNDDVLIAFHIQEPDSAGDLQDLDLSSGLGSLALNAKSTRTDGGTGWGTITAYNGGEYPAGEDLASGKFTMVFPFTETAIDDALGDDENVIQGWLELSAVISSAAQTFFQIKVDIAQELGVTVGTPPTSPTYYTAAESDALYSFKGRHTLIAASEELEAGDLVNGEKRFPVTAASTITLPDPAGLTGKGETVNIFQKRGSFTVTFDVKDAAAVIKSKLTPAGAASVAFALGACTEIRIELETPEDPTNSDYIIYTSVTP